ncbi:ATP-binding protein [Eilatimonas milleporae]|uniref:AAA domain-containing protein n=1 Tax=Eilatimonas milleporae TaxID=911205 RepID=A0A3M0C4D6_9PROT|nr:ATP-binding protein [Eilatimonas milleporae]RMB01949.1 AAA domain-containing protein [Eilatimonas milleporae]
MATVMRILGWKAQGLRCPDHEISCIDPHGQPFPVSLIQMPNGTGKTTTLALLRAALSGAAADPGWDRQTISEYRKKNGSSSEGYFEVRLLLNDRRATILMEFDFENGRVSYKTTHGPGRREGFNPPSDFRRFMNENFVNFYVFDGELAQHLLDREYTDAQVVVENLFQMNAFDAMARKVGEYWDSKTQNVSATEERGLARRQNRLASLRSHLAKCKREQQGLQEKRTDLTAQLQKKEDAYQQEIKKEDARFQALNNAETKVERLKGKVREEALDVLDRMRDPHALSSSFATSMLALKDGLDKVKLPESAAREFFEDLADAKECVCGRPIDAEISATIRTRAARYLGTEDVALLNSMKTAIKDAVGDPADEAEKDLNTKMASLGTAVEEERDARNDRDSLRLEAEQADPAVKSARDDIESLRNQIEGVDAELEKFDSKDQTQNDERTYGIEILERRIDDAERKLAEITHTLTEKTKRDTLTAIINSAHNKARTGITTELCEQANARISELMPHNSISIERIEQNLILEGQEGGSVGETLSIAYAFLATLFHRSDHQLPFVVDSPAGPIDLAVRPKIGELIPNLTGQFIAFTISSERARFITPLKRASRTEIQFITLFRKGSQELEREAHDKGTVLETGDGLNVTGEDFFNAFQLEEEEAA